jgi:putative oxidoreductase
MLKKARIAGLWLLQGLLALAMTGPGLLKFTSPVWQRMFRVWGYPEHFYLVIGAIEVVAGIGLLIPRFATPSAIVLMPIMLGAAVTRFRHGGGGFGEIVLLILLGMIAYGRRAHWLNRTGASTPGLAVRT